MSINRKQAEHHADQAEVAHAQLQDQLQEPDSDRLDSLRAAVSYHGTAALTYAVLAILDDRDPPDSAPTLAAQVASGAAGVSGQSGPAFGHGIGG